MRLTRLMDRGKRSLILEYIGVKDVGTKLLLIKTILFLLKITINTVLCLEQ